MNRLTAQIIAFLGIALSIILVILSFFIFSYLLIVGAAIGLILFIIAYVRARFFNKRGGKPQRPNTGRTIEHDDL